MEVKLVNFRKLEKVEKLEVNFRKVAFNLECWLSTWDHDMYMHIPKEYRLPIFPHLTTFTERASDKAHPHKKHYELFVKNIKPYVDKRQS